MFDAEFSSAVRLTTGPMVTFRHTSAWLFVAALFCAVAERADASVLLPDLSSVTEGEMAAGTLANPSSSSVPVVPESDRPLSDPIAWTIPAPAVPSTGASGSATGSGAGTAAMLTVDSLVVGDDLVEVLRPDAVHGWGLLHLGGVFRPPRSAA